MAVDTVTSRILQENEIFLIMQFTNVSVSGTGESNIKKVDVDDLSPDCGRVIIHKVYYNIQGMVVIIEWDASTDVTACVLQGTGMIDYRKICGGLTNNAGAGVTGDVLFTTSAHTAGDSYNIILVMEKVGV